MIHPKKLCQLEMYSSDSAASVKFFQEVFGWPAVPITIHEYTVLAVPDDSSFGISILSEAKTSNQRSNNVLPYFSYELDISSLLNKVRSMGGKLLGEPRLMPGYGHIYQIEDPGGIRLGISIASIN